MAYNKSFIILSKYEDNEKYNGITGYCKIEAKGSKAQVLIFVQGFYPLDAPVNYNVYIAIYENGHVIPIKLGKLKFENGKGEHKREVDIDNVLDTRIGLQKFNMIIVTRENEVYGNDSEVLLVGFHNIPKKDDWKNNFLNYLKYNRVQSYADIANSETEFKKNEQLEEESNDGVDNKAYKTVETKISEDNAETNLTEEINKNIDGETVLDGNADDEAIHTVKEYDYEFANKVSGNASNVRFPVLEEIKDGKKEKSREYANYYMSGDYRKLSDYLDSMKGVQLCNPFEKVKLKYKWWRVTDMNFFENIFSVSSTSSYVFYHPLVNKILRTERYCLFGLASDTNDRIRYMAFGFPAKYSTTDQLFFGGFSSFYPIKGHSKKSGDYGYWVVHIKSDSDSIVMTV